MYKPQTFKIMKNTGRQHGSLSVATQRSVSRRTASLSHIAIYVGFVLFLSLINPVSSQGVRVGNFIVEDTFTECQAAALEADVDMNKKLSSDEYVTFINIFSGDELEETAFGELPLRFVLIYNWVACFCSYEPGSSTKCCVGDNTHIALDNSTDSQQTLMFFCEQTDATINEIVGTAMPSLSLSPSTAPSPFPTLGPSSYPSDVPTGIPSLFPSLTPSIGPSSAPSLTPSSAPTVTNGPSSLPSELILPTQLPVPSTLPSTVPSYTPSAALTLNPSNAPSQENSGLPSFSPSRMASFIPSFSPTVPTIQPTVAGLLCINFQYSLRNEANLTASDIFNEVNNTLNSRLVDATGITVTDILNETYPMALRTIAAGGALDSVDGPKRGGSKLSASEHEKESDMPNLSQVLSVQQTHSESGNKREAPLVPLFGLNRRLYSSPQFASTVENAAIASLGGDLVATDLVRAELKEWKAAQDHASRPPVAPVRRSDLRRTRRLVFYTDDIPATIVSIADAPLFLCPGVVENISSRCVIISSKACVVLGPEDDEKAVRAALVQGLGKAINSGEFEENIPPEDALV